MHIAILDDCKQDIDELKALLCKYFDENNILADYSEFNSSKEFLDNFTPNDFTLAFIDIYLNEDELDGMEVATQVFSKDSNCRLIFSTVSQSHAVASYGVRASYYLTKPLSYPLLCDALDVICSDLVLDNRCIIANIGTATAPILLKDIVYVDCSAQRTQVHLWDKSFIITNKATDIFEQLSEDKRFLSCNRNISVNMDYIANLSDNDFLLQNGISIPIRQRGKKTLRKLFLEHSVKGIQRRN